MMLIKSEVVKQRHLKVGLGTNFFDRCLKNLELI